MIILPSGFENGDNPLIGFANIVTRSNISADQESAGAPVTQIANPSTYNPWSGTSPVAQNVTVTLSAAAAVDYVGIARHNLGTAAVSYRVQYSSNGSDWLNATDEVLPDDDGIILHVFDSISAQYWRLALGAGDAAPSMAVLYLGQIMQVTRRIYVGHTPLPMGRATDTLSGRSEDGNFLGRVVRKRMFETTIDLNHLDPVWYRENFDAFALAAETAPFFFGWRPTTYPDEVGYVWAMKNIQPANELPNGMMRVSFPVQGIVGEVVAGAPIISS